MMNCVYPNVCNETKGEWFSTLSNDYGVIYPVCERSLNQTNGTENRGTENRKIILISMGIGGTLLLVAL